MVSGLHRIAGKRNLLIPQPFMPFKRPTTISPVPSNVLKSLRGERGLLVFLPRAEHLKQGNLHRFLCIG